MIEYNIYIEKLLTGNHDVFIQKTYGENGYKPILFLGRFYNSETLKNKISDVSVLLKETNKKINVINI